MNRPAIHKLNGNECYVCSKCKTQTNELKGIKTKEGTEKESPRYKWVCNYCFTTWVSNGGSWRFNN